MKNEKAIDRSFQNNKNEVIETDVPKSGFNLTYRNHLGGLVLGRLYPQSIQHTMAGDKFSGSNEANVTFEQLATPVVDTMDVCVHNFYTTLRSIDKRWEKFMTPTKLNNMNSGLSVPTFSLSDIIYSIITNFIDIIFEFASTSTSASPVIKINLSNFYSNLSTAWNYVYHSDALLDLIDQIRVDAAIPSGSNSVTFDLTLSADKSKFIAVMTDIFDFFVGKRSLLDYLGYFYISHNDIDLAFNETNGFLSSTYLAVYSDYNDSYALSDWLYNSQEAALVNNFICSYSTDDSAWLSTQYMLQNEYALRAYYAIWFEYYRNYDLEPRSNSLPEYHDFAGNSIFDGSPAYDFSTLHYLVPRIRSWQQDAFTTAGIDDISRHVFAPLLEMPQVTINGDDTLQPSGIVDNNLIEQNIQWRNPATGVVSTINVPLPSRLVKALQSSTNTTLNPVGLELFSLRKAQMLENYLKRIYYGGDEYRDRMLHLYGSRIEDYRINRPQWLSSSLDEVNPRQEVANTGVLPTDKSGVSIGERYATATASQSGTDGFTEYSAEFGIVISMLSIMPHATYDPYLMQNLQIAYNDFPIPQFANHMEDVISALEISRQSAHQSFGYAPYAHPYRYRVDEVHGDYHDTKYDYCFLRFWNKQNVPNLSWSFIHCRPHLPMFVNSVLLDGQCYGTFKHNFLVERPLPSPVETI